MKKKLVSVLLAVTLLMTLSYRAAAENETPTLPEQIVQISDNDIVTPLAESPSIVNNGVYRIKNVGSGKYLNLHYGVDANGTNIYQWTYDGSTEQKWRISYNSTTEAYQIYSMSSSGGKNRVLDVTRGSNPLTSGQNVKLYTPTDPISQEVDFYIVSSGKYRIVMKNNTDLCLTSYGTSNGTSGGTSSTSAGNVFISNYTGSDNQKWAFEYTGTKVVVAPTGWIDSVSDTAISGWAWRSDLPNSPVSVSFDITNNDTGDYYYLSTTANVYRADLANAGYGNGYHGFSCAVDWKNDYYSGNYTITAYVGHGGATYNLSGNPKIYNNNGNITLGEKKSWNDDTYSGSYVPKTGWMQATFYKNSNQNYAKTYCEFVFDDYNVENILNYNSGTHEADSKNLYFTVDITNVRRGAADQMDAYAIYTSLPNPKTETENDDILGSRDEESEVVALGAVQVGRYNMYTYWYDYRNGDSNDAGQWQLQFGMSGQYLGNNTIGWSESSGDYNTVWSTAEPQIILSYGNIGGCK